MSYQGHARLPPCEERPAHGPLRGPRELPAPRRGQLERHERHHLLGHPLAPAAVVLDPVARPEGREALQRAIPFGHGGGLLPAARPEHVGPLVPAAAARGVQERRQEVAPWDGDAVAAAAAVRRRRSRSLGGEGRLGDVDGGRTEDELHAVEVPQRLVCKGAGGRPWRTAVLLLFGNGGLAPESFSLAWHRVQRVRQLGEAACKRVPSVEDVVQVGQQCRVGEARGAELTQVRRQQRGRLALLRGVRPRRPRVAQRPRHEAEDPLVPEPCRAARRAKAQRSRDVVERGEVCVERAAQLHGLAAADREAEEGLAGQMRDQREGLLSEGHRLAASHALRHAPQLAPHHRPNRVEDEPGPHRCVEDLLARPVLGAVEGGEAVLDRRERSPTAARGAAAAARRGGRRRVLGGPPDSLDEAEGRERPLCGVALAVGGVVEDCQPLVPPDAPDAGRRDGRVPPRRHAPGDGELRGGIVEREGEEGGAVRRRGRSRARHQPAQRRQRLARAVCGVAASRQDEAEEEEQGRQQQQSGDQRRGGKQSASEDRQRPPPEAWRRIAALPRRSKRAELGRRPAKRGIGRWGRRGARRKRPGPRRKQRRVESGQSLVLVPLVRVVHELVEPALRRRAAGAAHPRVVRQHRVPEEEPAIAQQRAARLAAQPHLAREPDGRRVEAGHEKDAVQRASRRLGGGASQCGSQRVERLRAVCQVPRDARGEQRVRLQHEGEREGCLARGAAVLRVAGEVGQARHAEESARCAGGAAGDGRLVEQRVAERPDEAAPRDAGTHVDEARLPPVLGAAPTHTGARRRHRDVRAERQLEQVGARLRLEDVVQRDEVGGRHAIAKALDRRAGDARARLRSHCPREPDQGFVAARREDARVLLADPRLPLERRPHADALPVDAFVVAAGREVRPEAKGRLHRHRNDAERLADKAWPRVARLVGSQALPQSARLLDATLRLRKELLPRGVRKGTAEEKPPDTVEHHGRSVDCREDWPAPERESNQRVVEKSNRNALEKAVDHKERDERAYREDSDDNRQPSEQAERRSRRALRLQL
mmetsp:Transcript_12975/g.38323  ORF Transcript_12975/g.38323 Transcript_12975/m.38323 type:complete len:1049 (+) Transcript_12975:1249-4395(+)